MKTMTKDDGAILVNVSYSMHLLLLAGESVKCQRTNLHHFLSRMKLLKPFLDYLREVKIPLPKVALLSFQYLDIVLQKAKDLVEVCGPKGSKMYMVYHCHQTVSKLQDLTGEMCSVLDTIPLPSLHISTHIRMQLERCSQELRKIKYVADAEEAQLSDEIAGVVMGGGAGNADIQRVQRICQQLGIQAKESLIKEKSAIEQERDSHCSKGGEDLISDQLIGLLNVMIGDDDCAAAVADKQVKVGIAIPPDFRCPLSQELMSDPVIVASGQTYERACIQQWLEQGNNTCPKTQHILSHTNLIPNYTVKALIANWCEVNRIPFPHPPSSLKLQQIIIHHQPFSSSSSSSSGAVTAGNETTTGNKKKTGTETGTATGTGTGTGAVTGTGTGTGTGNGTGNGDDVSDDEMMISSGLVDYSEAEEMEKEKKKKKSGGGGARIFSPSSRMRERRRVREKAFDVMSLSLSLSNDESKQAMIRRLIEELRSGVVEIERRAAGELRLLSKTSAEERIRIANEGGIKELVKLLDSKDNQVKENAVTALLNLSLNEGNKDEIVEGGAIVKLVKILKEGNEESKENAAATLFSLSVKQEYTAMVGKAGAIEPLVNLLNNGTPRGKKDAATALFNLSIYEENKRGVVAAGGVKALVELMRSPKYGMVDRAIAVLVNLLCTREGREELVEECEGGVEAIVEVVEAGSQRGKENAAAALLLLCSSNPKHTAIVFNHAVSPMLHILSHTGTARAKEKAGALLRLFRDYRR